MGRGSDRLRSASRSVVFYKKRKLSTLCETQRVLHIVGYFLFAAPALIAALIYAAAARTVAAPALIAALIYAAAALFCGIYVRKKE